MATYRVVPGTLSVEPVKSSYTTDEDVELRIRCRIQRKSRVIGDWKTEYHLYDSGGFIDKKEIMQHKGLPEEIDTEDDDFTWNIGRFSTPGIFNGYIVVKARG